MPCAMTMALRGWTRSHPPWLYALNSYHSRVLPRMSGQAVPTIARTDCRYHSPREDQPGLKRRAQAPGAFVRTPGVSLVLWGACPSASEVCTSGGSWFCPGLPAWAEQPVSFETALGRTPISFETAIAAPPAPSTRVPPQKPPWGLESPPTLLTPPPQELVAVLNYGQRWQRTHT